MCAAPAGRRVWLQSARDTVLTAMKRLFIALLITAGTTLAPAVSFAHKTNLATGMIALEKGRVTVTVKVSAHDLAVALGIPVDLQKPVPPALFEGASIQLEAYATDRLGVVTNEGPCRPQVSFTINGLMDTVTLVSISSCPKAKGITVHYDLFFDIDRSHYAIMSVAYPDGSREDLLFDASLTEVAVNLETAGPPVPLWARAVHIFWLGGEHIILGIDHVLFVLALVIGATGFWRIAGIVTAFTIAHSITLGLAWFEVVTVPARPVEILIALSIAIVAGLNLAGIGQRWHMMLAGVFGLVHGLGFYSAIADLGLVDESAALTLAAFNLGVEAGQLLIVGAVLLLLWPLRRVAVLDAILKLANLLIIAAALYWVAERSGFL